MITGTLMFDVAITCDNEQQLNDIVAQVTAVIKPIDKVDSVKLIDQDINEQFEEDPQESAE
jgi:DNA-binding FrmR family transcriptional regulator